MLKCVLFDFDGVVVQSELLHKKTFMEILSPFGVQDISLERWYKEFAGTGSKHIFDTLVKENHLNADVNSLVERRKVVYEACVRAGELKPTPGVEAFLKSIRSCGVKTGIVSGSHRTNISAALEILSLSDFFEVVISGDDYEKRKPDPKPFLEASWKLGIAPSECVAIEDSVSGCIAARDAGMKLIVVESPALPFVGKYDLAIPDFTGISYDQVAALFK
jgi:HAD superfamily hydrolase (TIGR01509 family)